MRRRQGEARVLRFNGDDAAGGHRAKPFTDVARVEARGGGDLLHGGGGTVLHLVEQPGAMPDREHQTQRAVVEHLDQVLAEGLGSLWR